MRNRGGKKLGIDRKNDLKVFVQKVDELTERSLFKDGLPRIHVSIGSDKPTEAELPDEEHFRSFVMGIRMFYLQENCTYFYYACNTLEQDADIDEDLKDRARKVRKAYKDYLAQSYIKINDVAGLELGLEPDLTWGALTDMYFAARYAHADQDKECMLDWLENHWPPEFLKYQFVASLLQIFLCVVALRNIIKEAWERN